MVRSSKSFVFNQRVEFFLVGIQILNADAVYHIFFGVIHECPDLKRASSEGFGFYTVSSELNRLQAFRLLHLISVAFPGYTGQFGFSGDNWMQWIGPERVPKIDNTKMRSI